MSPLIKTAASGLVIIVSDVIKCTKYSYTVVYSTFLYSVVYLILVHNVLVPVIHSVGLSSFLKDDTAFHPSIHWTGLH